MVNIWIDVEDLFEYARANPRPSGIQRFAYELYGAFRKLDADLAQVRFLRHTASGTSFRVVSWNEIADLFFHLTRADIEPGARLLVAAQPRPAHDAARRLVLQLPLELRLPALSFLAATRDAMRALLALMKAGWRSALRVPSSLAGSVRQRSSHTAGEAEFTGLVHNGDVLMACGSPWNHPDYGGLIRAYRAAYGMRFALLVYDIIPLRRPEWCDKGLTRPFARWFAGVLPQCDQVFAISQATAKDVDDYARRAGIPLAEEITVVPIGTETAGNFSDSAASMDRVLPMPGTYALIVSTIEARKNHMLLFRVWRRLLEELPPDDVPSLVFAGRVGWLVQDLMRQIENTSSLAGKLIIVESPSDAELKRLYEGCLFTLFPSFYEGWGLPVTESLAMGKPCLIADRTSLPEAGGKLARAFNPDNLDDAYAAIRGVIEDPRGLAAWEEQVRREFRPVPWSATAAAIVTALDGSHRPPPAMQHELATDLFDAMAGVEKVD